MSEPRITLLAGPTASGKSQLALAMAERAEAVILNADSQQLYRDLRILTARPSPEDETRAEHRLYGVADAAEAWSVGRWTRTVLAELDRLDGRPVVLVGGTGLYFHALTRGLAEVPPVSAEVRDAVGAAYDAQGETSARARLAAVDPVAEAAIERGDRQRLVRALAVHQATGRALSEWRADTQPLLREGEWRGLVIEPGRDRLYAACDERASVMLATGALDEVAALMARSLPADLPAMKAVGVRELAAHLRGETSADEALSALRQATRNYAKRQLTWFRNQARNWPRVAPPPLP